jgi:hypothetical protein
VPHTVPLVTQNVRPTVKLSLSATYSITGHTNRSSYCQTVPWCHIQCHWSHRSFVLLSNCPLVPHTVPLVTQLVRSTVKPSLGATYSATGHTARSFYCQTVPWCHIQCHWSHRAFVLLSNSPLVPHVTQLVRSTVKLSLNATCHKARSFYCHTVPCCHWSHISFVLLSKCPLVPHTVPLVTQLFRSTVKPSLGAPGHTARSFYCQNAP